LCFCPFGISHYVFLDIAPSEFLLTATVAVLVIGPKDMPRALRAAGRWMGKMRKVSNHFRAGIETMIREAELEDMEKKWREQNEAIMASVTASEAPAGSHLLAHEAPAIDPALAPHAPSEAHAPSEPVPPASWDHAPSAHDAAVGHAEPPAAPVQHQDRPA
jgi:sec-independent protein translocase protein TatB